MSYVITLVIIFEPVRHTMPAISMLNQRAPYGDKVEYTLSRYLAHHVAVEGVKNAFVSQLKRVVENQEVLHLHH